MAEKDHALLPSEPNVICLAGGVGGAKLADGLAQILPPEQLTIIVNTGDDFKHLGLTVCPDLDTVMYTLGGVANTQTGWGREGESWITIGEIERLGGPAWFGLGDLDLATHLLRSSLLAEGRNLTVVTQHLCRQYGIETAVLPMSNQPAPTHIITAEGSLPFQEWFVKERWQPVVRSVQFPENVIASAQVTRALETADIVLIAPSNPFVSIDPILNVYPIREMLMDLPRAVVAVSPIVGGKALKGPAAKMMAEMDMPVTATAVAGYYGQLIDGFVIDNQDEAQAADMDCFTLVTDTIMGSREDRVRLARETLDLAVRIAAAGENG
ncbi:MAG: 2-phospho-L-lactate transferase [Candidatus Promineifilaceae bacterium]|jgi:LPPG:FO 2-phospho-L-lactate transferase